MAASNLQFLTGLVTDFVSSNPLLIQFLMVGGIAMYIIIAVAFRSRFDEGKNHRRRRRR